MATKRYSVPKWLQEAKPTKVTHNNAPAMPSSKAPVSYSERKAPTVTSTLPTPKAGTINRTSGAKTILPSQIKKTEFKPPAFNLKVSPPSSKLDFKSHDDQIAGKTQVDKWNTVIDNAAKSPLAQLLINSAPNKIMQRAADSFVGSLDKAAGVDPSSHQSFNPETNAVENAIGDIIGFGAGMSTKLPGLGGGSVQGALTPMGNAASQLTMRGLGKASPVLPSAAGKAANYILPTLAKEGAEGALYGGAIGLSSGDGIEGIAKEAGKGAIENAAFGMGLKGAGDALNFTIKGIKGLGKVKVTGTDGAKVSYVDEAGNEKTMNQAIFKRAAQPLQRPVNLEQVKNATSELPIQKADTPKTGDLKVIETPSEISQGRKSSFFKVDSDIMDVSGHIPENGDMPFIDNIWYKEHLAKNGDSTEKANIPEELLGKGNATKHVLSVLDYFKNKNVDRFTVNIMSEDSNALMKSLEKKGYVKQVTPYRFDGDDVVYEITNGKPSTASTEPILAGLDNGGATALIKAETLPEELTAAAIDAPAAKQADIIPDKVNDEVMFKDEQGRLNAGTVSRLNDDGTAEILTPEGNSYRAKKNGDVYEASTSAATVKEQMPIEDRLFADNAELKDKNVIPYQQLHPELKGHIQQEADAILGELKRTTRGERHATKSEYFKDGLKITGNERVTSPEIAKLLDDGHSYDQIEKALNRIIEDHGSENTMLAKKIEALIDSRLSNERIDFETGMEIPANAEYVNAKNAIEGTSEPVVAAAETRKVLHPSMGANDRTMSSQDVVIGGADKQKTPLLQGLKDRGSYLYTHLVDINNPIKKLDETTYRLATNTKKVGGTVNAIFNDNLVDMEGKPIGESLKAIANDLPQDKEAFMKYVLQKHNIDRAREGKNVFTDFTSEESDKAVQLIEMQNPEWKALNDRLVGFVNKFTDTWGHKSGLIEDDLWKTLNETYQNYVPTQREFSQLEQGLQRTGGKGFVDQSNTLKKATGSERNIIDPMENIMNLVNRTVRTARYNEVGQNLVKAIEADPQGLAKYAEIIPETEMVPNPKFKKANTTKWEPGKGQEGSKLTPFESKAKNAEPEFIERKVEIPAHKDNIVSVLVDGKPVNLEIKDVSLLESLNAIHKNTNLNDFEAKVVRPLNNAFKALITQKNPLFTVTNILRDIPTAYVNGSERNLLKFGRDYMGAVNDIRKNSDVAQRYRAMGGEMANFFSPEDSAKAVANLTKKDNALVRGMKKIESINNAAESAPRLAEFKRSLKAGESAQDALFKAGEVTTNFSRGGDITKKADIYAPYLNASVQGIDKTMRQFKHAPIQTVLKGATIVTAPTMLFDYINKDNENYKELDNRTKDTYFLIPTGDTFIKIPKAREIGVLFGSLLERTLRMAEGEENAFKGFGSTISTNFTPSNPLTSNLAGPIVTNLFANKDFAGRTIVPMAMQGRSPQYQYDETTSEIGKKIGELANLSPKQVDYVIKSYTGIIGQLLLPAATASNYAGGKKSNLLKPVTNKFTADPLYSNQQMNDFYDNVDMLTAIASDYNFKNNIDSTAITNAEDMKNSFNKTMKEISALSKEATKSTNPDEARMIRRQMVELAAEANKTLPTTDKKKLEKLLVGIRKEAKAK